MGPFADGWTQTDVEDVLERDDPLQVLYVPIVVGMNAPDCGPQWAQDVCERLASHRHWNVRANAMLGIAHIARTCRQLNTASAIATLVRGLQDHHATVRLQAMDAANDLQQFLGVGLPGMEGDV